MKKSITVNFKDIVPVLKAEDLKICFIHDRWLFIEDNQGNLYQMENYYVGSYLDKLIKDEAVVNFKLVDASSINGTSTMKKELWDAVKVQEFMEIHCKLSERQVIQ